MNTEQFNGHTPGPWTVDVHKVGENISALLIESDMTTHSNCVLAEVEVENKYAEADAQLIAAAPELLAEVERLRQAFLIAASCGEDGWGHLELWQTLEDAGINCDALPSGQWSDEE